MSDKEAQEVYAKAGLGESVTLGSRPARIFLHYRNAALQLIKEQEKKGCL